MPFCEMETEKSRFEDKLHRSLMLDALSKKMDKKNYEVDEYRTKAEKELKESLFNLFVVNTLKTIFRTYYEGKGKVVHVVG